ncbi:MAG TPA: hypothetical protein VN616_03330 [Puia sp.]|nr:hypothetical protein [Puia sp.]
MKRSLKTALVVIAIPVLYALILRVVFGLDIVKDFASVMSVSFVTLVPTVIGFLTVFLSAARKPDISIGYALTAPLIPIFLLFFLTLIFGIEGWACWIMILPVFIVFGSLGGLVARYLLLFRKKKRDRFRITLVLLLPVFASPVEKLTGPLLTRYKADTSIDIRAPAGRIWANVVRVPTITEQEDQGKLTNFLGFPRPIRAELDFAGVGGSRQAIFSKGLVFREVVLDYTDRKKMHFSITANPHDIPSTTMDRHVVIGGDYFNVLDGTYELQELNDSVFRLHLYSHFTLNTHFNFYASWWAGWIMKDIQNNILQVIATRCQGKL